MKVPKQHRAVERKVNRLATRPVGVEIKPSDWPVDPMVLRQPIPFVSPYVMRRR
jgi:hypothetical protein